MLASTLGIRLVVWTGKPVPKPAPADVLAAISSVEVSNDAEQGDGFQITLTLNKTKTGDYSALLGGAVDQFTRVIIGVVLGVTPEVLIDGVVTHHQLLPGKEPGTSTLTVTGKDIGAMLDLEEKNAKFENQPDSVIVTRVVAGYAEYGLIPRVTATTDVPIAVERIPRQYETDLQFIRRLAARNGFVFYIEPTTFGVNTAYWGPENRLSLPQPALTVNLGAADNVTSVQLANDGLAAVASRGTFVEPITKISIPIPALPSLRVPSLVATAGEARRTMLMRETANRNAVQAALALLAGTTRAPEPVTAEGEADTVRYGSVLRARRLVGLRGVGLSYDGDYYVRRVTHNIKSGSYTQRFSLSREGTGALSPAVRP